MRVTFDGVIGYVLHLHGNMATIQERIIVVDKHRHEGRESWHRVCACLSKVAGTIFKGALHTRARGVQ